MTFQTGSANDLADLLSKLSTFADTTHGGWTAGYSPNPQTTDGWFELHKGNLSVSAKYPLGAQGPAEHMSLHQASGFINSSTAPGAHTADSGNGYNSGTTGHTNANLLVERCVRDIGDGLMPTYHFFADDTATHDYIHVAVQATSGMYRHFGFGNLVKFGDNWTGGEYVYGQYMDTDTNAHTSDVDHVFLLDGLGATAARVRGATLRIASGLPNQGAAVWGVSAPLASASMLTDTAGNIRQQIHGGTRAGMEARGFGNPIGNGSSGLVPMHTISAFYRDPNNPRVYLLGHMPDVRILNIRNFTPGEEVTIGSDTWVVFPMSIRTTALVSNRSQYMGVAYKKVA